MKVSETSLFISCPAPAHARIVGDSSPALACQWEDRQVTHLYLVCVSKSLVV